jgi:hypothetical protein
MHVGSPLATRPAPLPTTVRRSLEKRPVSVKATVKEAPTSKNADAAFGTDIFQSAIYGLTNLGQIISLPSFLGSLVRALPLPTLALFNMGMGAFQLFRDLRALKAPNNQRKWDDYTRMGASGAMLLGGGLLFTGAAVSSTLPLVGAALAAGGFFTRIVGIWNDDTRI